MNPNKTQDHIFHQHHAMGPSSHIIHSHSQPSIPLHDDPSFSLPEIVLFRSSPSADSPTPCDSDNDDAATAHPPLSSTPSTDLTTPSHQITNQPLGYISPEPHISSQFYTFNAESHSLMIRCIREQRLATPAEIRAATPRSVLKSWRAVWKDRNEDTAYLTAWKRIQDKLTAHVDPNSVYYNKIKALQLMP